MAILLQKKQLITEIHLMGSCMQSVILQSLSLLLSTPVHSILYYLNYLNYLVPLHIDSVLVLLAYSLVIVVIVLTFPFLFSKYLSYFLTLHCCVSNSL